MQGDEEREGGPRAPGHVPVMLDRDPGTARPRPVGALRQDAVFVDATLGLGGHAEALLAAHPRCTLIGLDRDTTAIERSRRRLAPYAGRVTLVHAVYDEIPEVLRRPRHPRRARRRSSTSASPPRSSTRPSAASPTPTTRPLDMRMDRDQELTAEAVVNTYSAAELTRILRDYGEERFARRVADAIVRERGRAPLTSTSGSSRSSATRSLPPRAAPGVIPGKRTFQALRMEVNGELAALRDAVPAALDALVRGRPRGRPLLPLARGPHRQAGPRRAHHRHHTAGPAGSPAGTTAAVPPAHSRRGTAVRRGDHDQPTGRLGTPSRGRADPWA